VLLTLTLDWTSSVHIRGCGIFLYACRWSEPVYSSLLLPLTIFNWSLAPAGDDVDSATHDVLLTLTLNWTT
jgi:hypothetical protein